MMLKMKKLAGLIEFIAVVDHKGFTAAADALGMSASYVSRRVSALEAHLGIRLLNRSTRSVNLTEIGSQYYDEAAMILGQLDELETKLANQQKRVMGDIKISAGGSFGENAIALALADFALEYPEINLDLDVSNRQIDLSVEGFDLAIRHGSAGDPDLISRKLTSRRMVVCASPDYFARHGIPKTPGDLHQHNCLKSKGIPWKFKNSEDSYEVKVAGNWSSNNGQALLNAALRHLGVVRLADIYVKDALKNNQLEIVLQEYEIPPSTTFLVYPAREYLPYRIRTLIDFLVEYFK